MWRLLIGFGLCFRESSLCSSAWTIPETPRFTMDIERNVRQATQDIDDVLTQR